MSSELGNDVALGVRCSASLMILHNGRKSPWLVTLQRHTKHISQGVIYMFNTNLDLGIEQKELNSTDKATVSL